MLVPLFCCCGILRLLFLILLSREKIKLETLEPLFLDKAIPLSDILLAPFTHALVPWTKDPEVSRIYLEDLCVMYALPSADYLPASLMFAVHLILTSKTPWFSQF